MASARARIPAKYGNGVHRTPTSRARSSDAHVWPSCVHPDDGDSGLGRPSLEVALEDPRVDRRAVPVVRTKPDPSKPRRPPTRSALRSLFAEQGTSADVRSR